MAWTTPITWTNGAVTAATANTEWRDHLNFLKAALDLLTAGTTTDSGTSMYLDLRGAAGGTTNMLRIGDTGEANPQFTIDQKGKMAWGVGGASAPDSFLERAGAAVMTLSGDSTLRNTWSTGASNTYFTGRASGDAFDRVRLDTTADGSPELKLGDGATSGPGIVTYDVTNTRLIVAAGTSQLRLTGSHSDTVAIATGPTATPAFIFRTGSNQFTFGNQSIQTSGTGLSQKIEMGGYVLAQSGLAIKTKAGTVADGDFLTGADSGAIAVDTTNGFLAVRDGSTWRGIDMRGAITSFGPFTWPNLAASATVLPDYGGLGPSGTGTGRPVAPWPGSIVGMTVRGSAACTAGSATFTVTVNGTLGTLQAIINTSDSSFVYASQSPGIDTFTAGQGLSFSVTTSSGFLPAGSTEYFAVMFVLFRRGGVYS